MNANALGWRPDVYLGFAAHRARPVADLLPRIVPPDQGTLYDLGCGPGNVTALLKARWNGRTIVAIDSSAAMLDAARAKYGAEGISWQHADISHWSAPSPAALIFANAALHWVPDHERVFPHLVRSLAPGGVLAVQMPVGQRAPYHTCIDEIANRPRWRGKFADVHRQTAPLAPGAYYDLLAPLAGDVDIWETNYHHELAGENPVAAWAAGTALVPYTSVLDASETNEFVTAYAQAVREAYPPQKNGRTLFCMRRIFILARGISAD